MTDIFQDPSAGGPDGRTAMVSRRERRRGAGPVRRLDESMTLLREVMERPLDPGYATAAARKAHGRPRGRRRTTSVGLGVVAVLLGVLVTWSVAVLRQPEPGTLRARDVLLDRIDQQTLQNDEARAQIEELRRQARAAQDEALRRDDPAAAAQAVALQVAAGAVAVVGPGLRIEMDDAAGSRDAGGANVDPRDAVDAENGRVFDQDLQTVVNGLWLAGAEAIDVNGQRLTMLSAIRSAGEAILVDFRPLVPPYVIQAVGDPEVLETQFTAGAAGAYLASLQENFGITAGMSAESELRVEAAGSLVLRLAAPVDAADDGGTAATPSALTERSTPIRSGSTTSRATSSSEDSP